MVAGSDAGPLDGVGPPAVISAAVLVMLSVVVNFSAVQLQETDLNKLSLMSMAGRNLMIGGLACVHGSSDDEKKSTSIGAARSDWLIQEFSPYEISIFFAVLASPTKVRCSDGRRKD